MFETAKLDGWPARKCPGCGQLGQPGERIGYAPEGHPGLPENNGDVFPWHEACLRAAEMEDLI